MPITEESDMVEPSANFPIVDSRDYDVAEKTMYYFQVNHVIDRPKTQNAKSEENFKEVEVIFMFDSKALIHKTSVDPNLLQLKVCIRNIKKALEDTSTVFNKLTERFGSLFTEGKFVIHEELEKQVVDALHFASTKMLAESNLFWCSGKRKDFERKCNTCKACMSSGKNLK